jgi:hypothetical protein
MELRVGIGSTVLDRKKMDSAGQSSMFIIQLSPAGLSGQAAPNKFFAPYNMQSSHTLTLRPLESTSELASLNIGGLMEDAYLFYLQRINSWQYRDGRLWLYAPYSINEEAILIYAAGQ